VGELKENGAPGGAAETADPPQWQSRGEDKTSKNGPSVPDFSKLRVKSTFGGENWL
jgi:hypothetical protein